MSQIFRSTAFTIFVGAGAIALSFWFTLQAMEYLWKWDDIRPNVILTFGGATSSTIALTRDTKLQLTGDGYIEFQNTQGLQCLKFKCRFSLAVTFAPVQSNTQLIIGQSFLGEPSWHLLLQAGRLLLQRQDDATELGAPFSPRPGQNYKIDIVRTDQEAKLSVDEAVVASGNVVPFTDIARNLTIGGRAGASPLGLTATVTDVQIGRQKSPE